MTQQCTDAEAFTYLEVVIWCFVYIKIDLSGPSIFACGRYLQICVVLRINEFLHITYATNLISYFVLTVIRLLDDNSFFTVYDLQDMKNTAL